jgi:hypothetical protein
MPEETIQSPIQTITPPPPPPRPRGGAPGFLNPYPDLSRQRGSTESGRIYVDVARCDSDLLHSVLIRHGSFQTALKLFINSLAQYARNNDYNFADADRFEQHIVNVAGYAATGSPVSATIPTTTSPGLPAHNPQRGLVTSAGHEPGGNVGGGVATVCPTNPSTTDVKPVGAGEQTRNRKKGQGQGKVG